MHAAGGRDRRTQRPTKPWLSLGVMKLPDIKRLFLPIEGFVKPLPCDHSSVFVNHFDRPELMQWIIKLLHFQFPILVKSRPCNHSSFPVKDFHPPMLILWIVHLLLGLELAPLVESLEYDTASVAVDFFRMPEGIPVLSPAFASHANY